MANKRYSQTPMMFIQQPKIKNPKANMQHTYNSPRQSEKEGKEETIKKRQKPVRPRQQPIPSQANIRNSEQNQEDEEKPKKKKFKEMTIKEKIEYFSETPKHLPKMKCMIKTESRSYRGIVLEIKDNIVHLHSGRRLEKIPLDSIKEVQMLGL